MTLVAIAGSGLAELTCARLLLARGHRVRPAPPPAGPAFRPLLLTGPALDLLGSLWGDELPRGGWWLTHRQVRWGAGERSPRFPQRAYAVDGAALAARMRELLDLGDGRAEPPGSGEPPEWTVTADAASGAVPGGSVLRQCGRRTLLAGTAPLRRGGDRTTARLDCTELGWLQLTPLGGDHCLVQAMVPGPAADPAGLLARVLAESPLAALLSRPPRTAVAPAAAPRVHLAPAVPPGAPRAGGGRLVVGAGALRQDPLSGTGTAQALRTAILAAAVIDAAARGVPVDALCAHYTTRLRVAHHDHLRTCLRLYESAFTADVWQDEIDTTRSTLRGRGGVVPPRYGLSTDTVPAKKSVT
ncbi:hypothetical protein F9278_16600 [Streptomyces phaeolivaceus]|uniref:Uncharacterized protein n=1 Tax=Streptomyces phaeolivaceus TaxID=2653200 RepID=A0A5P8K4K9_9ACTN|nr:hypothetical protein [Streptomyces phaeolivaceus]QFQ97567.1 hypothetical protein F9278_16600 [Streptomyces phaeolivaceus]